MRTAHPTQKRDHNVGCAMRTMALVNDVRVWYVGIGAHGAPYGLSRDGVNDGHGVWGG